MKEELLRLFSDYLEDVDFLNNEQKVMLMQLASEGGIVPFLYDCIYCMVHLKEKAEIREKLLSFDCGKECHFLWGKDYENKDDDYRIAALGRKRKVFQSVGTVLFRQNTIDTVNTV